jgi:NADPH:quinone reductase-like Zn-dependent oxidoreductase
VVGTGRSADRGTVLELGAHTFLDLEADSWEDTDQVDVVFDVIGGDVIDRSAALVRPGGTFVSVAHPPTGRPADGRSVFSVVEPARARLADLARRLRAGRLRVRVGAVRPLAEAADAFTSRQRVPGRTIIRVAEG